MKLRVILTVSFILYFIFPALSLNSIGILNGYLFANLDYKQDLKNIPLLVSFNFNGKSLFSCLKDKLRGDIVFSLEPFINTIYQPDANVEIGTNFLFKYIFPSKGKIKPYVKGGLGIEYMTQHIREQSTQYNFLPQIGGGISFFLDKHTSLDFEYRFRHLSNASFKTPNGGVDANVFLWGFTHYF